MNGPTRPPAQANNQSATYQRLPSVKKIIAVGAGKGGVGKSTVAVNLAVALSRLGASVGLLDGDIYGPSIPTMLGLRDTTPEIDEEKRKIKPLPAHGISCVSMGFLLKRDDAVVWRGPMLGKALQQFVDDVDWGELDYLVVDLPPGTSDIHITLSQNFEINGSIIITTPQKISTIDAEKAVAMFKKENTKVPILGIIQNMSHFISDDGHKHFIFGEDGGRDLSRRLDLELLGDIPIDKNISKSSDNGYPVVLKEENSSSVFTDICHNIARKIAVNNFK